MKKSNTWSYHYTQSNKRSVTVKESNASLPTSSVPKSSNPPSSSEIQQASTSHQGQDSEMKKKLNAIRARVKSKSSAVTLSQPLSNPNFTPSFKSIIAKTVDPNVDSRRVGVHFQNMDQVTTEKKVLYDKILLNYPDVKLRHFDGIKDVQLPTRLKVYMPFNIF